MFNIRAFFKHGSVGPEPVNFQLGPFNHAVAGPPGQLNFSPEKLITGWYFQLKSSVVISVLCKPWRPTISHAAPAIFLAESRFFIGKIAVLSFCLQHAESLGLIRFVSISGCQFFVCLFDSLRPLNNLSVMRDGSSWVEPVLS